MELELASLSSSLNEDFHCSLIYRYASSTESFLNKIILYIVYCILERSDGRGLAERDQSGEQAESAAPRPLQPSSDPI